jgi:hypothetical protein
VSVERLVNPRDGQGIHRWVVHVDGRREEALREHPELVHLETLKNAGWGFRPMSDENGEPTCLVGFRHAGGPYTDAIYIYDINDSVAVRLVEDQSASSEVVWRCTGPLTHCVHELLALPSPPTLAPPRDGAMELGWDLARRGIA